MHSGRCHRRGPASLVAAWPRLVSALRTPDLKQHLQATKHCQEKAARAARHFRFCSTASYFPATSAARRPSRSCAAAQLKASKNIGWKNRRLQQGPEVPCRPQTSFF